jgi:hypothetical protein
MIPEHPSFPGLKSETWGTHICHPTRFSDPGHPPICLKTARHGRTFVATMLTATPAHRKQRDERGTAFMLLYWLGFR